MIRYTVLWSPQAEDELAKIWCDYPDRRAISMATDHIDAELATDAHQKGFPMPNRARAISSGPLSAFYRVIEADCKVLVACVQLTEVN